MRIQYRDENPKRAGSKAHERYEKYKAAKTVAEAIRLGAVRGDVSNDVKQGFCTLLDGTDSSAVGAGKKRLAEGEGGPAKKAAVEPKDVAQVPRPKEPAGVRKAPAEAPAPPAAPPAEAPAEAPAAPPAAPSEPAAAPSEPAAVPPEAPLEAPAAPPEAAAEVPPAAPPPAPSETAAPSSSACSTPSSSSQPSALSKDVDLSFAKLEGKPMKFIKRSMGEAKRLLCEAGLAEAKEAGYKFSLIDRDNLSKWLVQITDLNPDGKLIADLRKHELEPLVDLELSLPDGFPLEPPFARVVYPQLHGGYVFQRGGICFEPLTKKGWVPSMTLPALAIAIKGILDYGEVRVAGVGNKEKRTVPHYTEEGARKDHAYISNAHREGEGSTYGSLKNYAS
eukprot:TRINITY_DN11087_c0_g1_i1.p1 TRINITY_DN11087_c0_g1~~TRINITY_DN11087_c0_g1_i1.p1  ORF type:complete len:430 (+),score=128.82 TRINITY_DN11087_c0_g1_i1:116-1291(+)